MRKSSSHQLFPVRFNPNEFKVGQSQIDTLPLRRLSASQLPLFDPTLKEEVRLLRQQNEVLNRENKRLRLEVECSRQQASTRKCVRTEEKGKDYLGIIKDKMNSQARQSRNTECQTGLYSSKEVSMEPSSLNISDYYDQFNVAQKAPALSDLQDLAARFFRDYCDSYAKLVTLFQYITCSPSHPPYKKLKDLIDLYKVPLVYQQSPQTLLRQVSKSKERLSSQSKQGEIRKKGKDQVCWEALSPEETVARTEGLLRKVCRSGSMLRMLSHRQAVLCFMKKLQGHL